MKTIKLLPCDENEKLSPFQKKRFFSHGDFSFYFTEEKKSQKYFGLLLLYGALHICTSENAIKSFSGSLHRLVLYLFS